MADIKISELSQAESLSLSDLMESAIPYNGGFQSRRMTLAQLSNYLENSVLHNALDTTTKNIIGAINEILHDLANYYTTSQTYSKTEVDTLIAGVSGLHFEVVNALPTQDIDMNTIYLVPKQDSGQQDVYDEFICLDDTTTPATWEKIGSTQIDLSDYVTDTELATILNDYVTTSGLSTILASYATTSAMTTALADKVDKVQGKGLSTEDYTTVEKAKLHGIEPSAQVNVQADWTESDSSSDAFILHKPTITDEKVKQSPINDYVAHEVLLSKSTDGLEHTEEAYKSSGLKFQHGASSSQFYIGDYDSQEGYYKGHVYCRWIDCYTLNVTEMGGLLAIEIGNQQTAGIIRLRNSNGGIIDMFAPTDITEGETVRFPSSSGQLALKSEIPTVVSELTDDVGIVKWSEQNVLGAKNLLPYPYINNIGVTSAGVTYTVDEKGWIHCSGTSTGNSIFTCSDKTVNGGMFLPNGNYRVSGCPEGGSSSGGNGAYQLIIDATISGATYTYCYETGDGAIFTVNGDDFSNDGAWVRVRCVCRKTVVSDSLVFKPMVMLASIKDNTYEPQANTNRQLTLNKIDKELIAPTENGFNASQAYAVGDYMFWRSGFYRVTTAISQGGAITSGTNVTKTTLGAELKRALS